MQGVHKEHENPAAQQWSAGPWCLWSRHQNSIS